MVQKSKFGTRETLQIREVSRDGATGRISDNGLKPNIAPRPFCADMRHGM
jgi:hypothetical protein